MKNYGKDALFSKTFEYGCPKFFHDIENRCSQLKINVDIKKRRWDIIMHTDLLLCH